MIEQYDIVTLGNDLDYAVVDIVNHNNVEYFLLNEIDKEEDILENIVIAKKITKDNQIFLRPIIDEEFEEIKKIFINKLYQE